MTQLAAADLDHILKHTAPLWSDLRGQRIFMTGGTGFFGCWLLETLIHANEKVGLGAEILVLTRNPEAFHRKAPQLASNPAVRFLKGDVRNFEFPDGEFPIVIHAATEASDRLNRESPLVMLDAIIEGTRRTLDFAASHGTRMFLLTSSGAVYGRQPPEITHEPEDYLGGPDLMGPITAYAEGKRVAEFMGATYAARPGGQAQGKMAVKIARCYALLGPYLPLDIHYAAGNFIGDVLAGRPIVIRSDGTPCRSYLYAADLVVWLLTILVRGQSCRPYNVGSEQAVSIAELAKAVAESVDPPAKVRILGTPKPGAIAERYVPSTQRAQKELGLRDCFDLAESIRRTIAWHRSREQKG
jgi:nucleoside-diphosphate-sugar epimerase